MSWLPSSRLRRTRTREVTHGAPGRTQASCTPPTHSCVRPSVRPNTPAVIEVSPLLDSVLDNGRASRKRPRAQNRAPHQSLHACTCILAGGRIGTQRTAARGPTRRRRRQRADSSVRSRPGFCHASALRVSVVTARCSATTGNVHVGDAHAV